jgi:hypothetical protein
MATPLPRILSPGTRWSPRTEQVALAILCVGSLILRISVLRFHPLVTWDGAYYVNYFRDTTWQSVFHPGYPVMIELFRLFIPDGVQAAQAVSVAFGALLPIPLFFVARQFMGSLPGLLAAAAVVLNPLVIRFSVLTMTESQFLFLEVLAFLLFLKRRPFLFGLASAFAYLTRPEAIVFFLALTLVDVFQRRDVRFLGLLLAGFLALALPYMIYLRVQTGEWTLSAKTMNLRVWERDWHLNVARESSGSPAFTFTERLESGFRHYPERLLAYVRLLFTYAGIPLVLLGIAGMFRVRNILLAGMPMLLVLPVFGLDPAERFLIPYLPFLAIFALLFCSSFRSVSLAVAGAALVVLGYSPSVSTPLAPEEGITEFCAAGRAMAPVTAREDIFVDRKPFTAFYAGGRYVSMPNDPVDSILSFSRSLGAKYLVVSARVVRVFRPQLNFLLYSDTVLNRMHLTTAYVAGLDSGYGVRIIQLKK